MGGEEPFKIHGPPPRDHQALPSKISKGSPKNFPKTTPKGSSPSTSLKDLQRISKKLPKDALRTTPKGKPRLPPHPPRADDLGNQDGIHGLKGARIYINLEQMIWVTKMEFII